MEAPASSERLRIRLAPGTGRASVATGISVLDHLLAVLAEWGRFDLELETAPMAGSEEEIDEVGRALGRALRDLLEREYCRGHGAGIAPAEEALAQVALERSEHPLVVANVDLSGEHVGGLGTDLVSRLLEGVADAAGLTLHVRLLEGEDARHVLEAIFKALGLALAEACAVQGE